MGQAALKLEAKGELLSKAAIAKRCKLHVQTVSSRLEDLGYEPHETSTPKNQLYWFDSEVEFELKAAKDTVSAMKIRVLRVDAQTKELKLAEMRGEVVAAIEVVEMSQNLHTAIYKEMAINMPKRLAKKLAQTKSVPEVTKIMKMHAEKFLKQLREQH
jgi:hypothetical protein